jgi:hypothetical protein
MEILNLGGSYEPSARAPKKKFKVLLGVGLLAAVMGMGSTLAASITLSSGNPVEFGQGVAATTACDGTLTVTPYSTYVNRETSTAAGFVFSSVTISNLDTSTTSSSGVGCGGRFLVLKAYTDSSTVATNYASGSSHLLADPLYLGWKYTGGNVVGGYGASGGAGYNSGISISIPSSGSTCTVKVASTQADNTAVACAMTAGAAGAASVTLTFGTGSNATVGVASSAVAKLTLESNAADPSGWV